MPSITQCTASQYATFSSGTICSFLPRFASIAMKFNEEKVSHNEIMSFSFRNNLQSAGAPFTQSGVYLNWLPAFWKLCAACDWVTGWRTLTLANKTIYSIKPGTCIGCSYSERISRPFENTTNAMQNATIVCRYRNLDGPTEIWRIPFGEHRVLHVSPFRWQLKAINKFRWKHDTYACSKRINYYGLFGRNATDIVCNQQVNRFDAVQSPWEKCSDASR